MEQKSVYSNTEMFNVFDADMIDWDEIVSIVHIGEIDTIDINVSGNKLFWANDILTHNCAVEAQEFDHSHIAGGISKINTADNVFGIYTSASMKERGEYQLQVLKARSASCVGHRIDLAYNQQSLRIVDADPDRDITEVKTNVDIAKEIKSKNKSNLGTNVTKSAIPQSAAPAPSALQANMANLLKKINK